MFVPISVQRADGSSVLSVAAALAGIASGPDGWAKSHALGRLGEITAKYLLGDMKVGQGASVVGVAMNPQSRGLDAVLRLSDGRTVPFEMKATTAANPRSALGNTGTAGGYRQGTPEHARHQAQVSRDAPPKLEADVEWAVAQQPLVASPEQSIFGVLHAPSATVFIYTPTESGYSQLAAISVAP